MGKALLSWARVCVRSNEKTSVVRRVPFPWGEGMGEEEVTGQVDLEGVWLMRHVQI